MDDRKKKSPEPQEKLHLNYNREEFVDTFFKKGAEFAAELLDELQALRKENKQLINKNANLIIQLASDDAIRDLLVKIDELEREKSKLEGHANNAVKITEDYADRYSEVEKELDTMANLYVALYQLHSTLVPNEVLGVIEQLLAQFVGAGNFVIYLKRNIDGDDYLVPIHAYHCNNIAGTQIKWGTGPIGETAETKLHFVGDSIQNRRELSSGVHSDGARRRYHRRYRYSGIL